MGDEGLTVGVSQNRLLLGSQSLPLLSGEVHFFRMDPQVWEKCLLEVKSFGLPIVSTYLSWRRFSTGPGQYDLTGRSDPRLDLPRFLELCRQVGLWVLLKPGPWICAEERNGGYPDWLVEDADLQALDVQGRPVVGYGEPFQSPIPSYLHPKYQHFARGWLRAVDEVVRKYTYPRGPVVMIQLDNEPCYTFHDGMFEADYNPASLRHYRSWLEAKYRSVAELNRAHQARHASFEELEPPRSLEGLRLEALPRYRDWVEFKEWTLARHVASLGEVHLENGIDNLLFTINLNERPQLATPNNWQELERASGLAGFDYYPAHLPMQAEEVVQVARAVSYSRCALKAVWSPEMMCGIWNFEGQEYREDELKPEDFEYLYFTALAFGLKGMNFYMLADRDHWVHAPLNAHGERTPTAGAVDRVMQFFQAVPEFPEMDRPQPVGVLYYRPYAHEAYIVGGQSLEAGAVRFDRSDAIFTRAYATLLRANLDPAILDLEACPHRLEGVRLLFSPGGRSMERAVQERLRAFVEAGGALVFLPSPPEQDERFEPFGLFPPGAGRITLGRGWLLSLEPERLETTWPHLAGELDLLPEVRPDRPGVLTTCQYGEKRALLFAINTLEENVEVWLRFRRRESGRLVSVLSPGASESIRAGQACVSLAPRRVAVYWVE